ncbi:MAG: UDP-glucose/GDP-mannose dehydrogenase dimerization [Parcubacteria group bacterium GW2011_GWA2_38_13]|nr:MAG: UDP-glucose/GDP-mannose dehydrogenase dimerization [Parcubacteria group bacterium GW2011_GWA2_38_13]
MHKSVGIIGGGVVGKAVKNFFKNAKVYDKFLTMDPWDEVASQEYIFICVPTPYNENSGFDASIVDEVLEKLSNMDGKVVIIKSTVVPGTTDMFQEKYPKLRLLFNPEFLDNSTAPQDFLNPDKQIVGYTKLSKDVAEKILAILPQAKYSKIMLAKAAEMTKYMVNSYYATKVIFANQIYDICQSLGIDYNIVREAFEHDRRVAPGNFDVWHGGFRGFGGKCLPKDLASLVDLAQDLGVEVPLLEDVQKINEELLGQKKQLT